MAKWKIYLFGAGKQGKYWLRYLKSWGVKPEGFIDNSNALQGGVCEELPVYGADRLKSVVFDYIFITCRDEQVIYSQLLGLGIAARKIIAGYHSIRNYLFYHAVDGYSSTKRILRNPPQTCRKVLFDLQNGMVLGGVEAWSYELAGVLRKQGIEGAYLTIDNTLETSIDKTYPAYKFRYNECAEERERIDLCVRAIAKNLPCTIICNFPQYIFWSACIAKAQYPELVRIIAVQHNDDQPYYEAYSLWQEYLDRCMVISSLMKDKQLSYGMSRGKMMCLDWVIPCDKHLERTWSEGNVPLRIGYAGRVTVTQKRADLLMEAALRLRELGIEFCLSVAGTGAYSEMLSQKVQENRLEKCIKIMGYIDRKNIPDFWRGQDIMVSCSEWEGHSISQAEAMAAGAVPVITDVSGARDDVIDGCNGFVVPVGDLNRLVDRICYLDQNRDMLKCMGIRAHDTIYERQMHGNQAAFWDNLLKEVWVS
ncbi:MAG: glycosyltransferase [Lachnospiraceae bacterium]|nr:glycosyltransferase [Lachnospiraceae bacterium]